MNSKLSSILCIYTIILIKSVCLSQLTNCRSQFLLDRLGRCLKLFVSTESTSCHEFASQFGLEFVYMRKTLKTSEKPGHQCQCLFQWPATSHCHQRSGPSRLGATDPLNSDNLNDGGVCVGVCTHSRWCVRMHLQARARLGLVRNNFADCGPGLGLTFPDLGRAYSESLVLT